MCHGAFMGSGGFVRRVLVLAASTAIAGCPKNEPDLAPAPEAPFPLLVAIESGPGHPIGGAKVIFKTKPIATSDNAGIAKVEVSGTEGETISLAIQCPDGFASSEKPLVVGLRHLGPGSPPPRFESRCTPVVRTLVVALRTENGPNLPIMQLGRPIARTDANGVAHFVVRAKPSEQITLTLSTADKGAEALRPQNPSLQFVAKDHDELVLLEQKFKIEKKKVYIKVAPKPTPL
jgi:hypothetical protein